MENFDFSKIDYKYRPIRKPKTIRDVQAIGFDSEADREGRTFLYALSDGTICTPSTLVDTLFTRQYRGRQFVVYNLKYEQGAILQNLPSEILDELRRSGTGEYEGLRYKVVGYKCLRITKGRNAVTFWDMYSFFNMSLASAARQFTNIKKMDIDVELFVRDYIRDNWSRIAEYCVRDAAIVEALFYVLKGMCAKLGINPTTFYSIATIGYKYARENTKYITVNHFWKEHREVLEAACKAYSGGKFEVTTRGKGYFYEYDINSAYPYEIANLADISRCRVIHSKEYRPGATYGFLHLDIFLDEDVYHPIAYKRGTVNIYPVGRFKRWVTMKEYEFIRDLPGSSIKILKAVYLYPRYKRKPYRKLIANLYRVKAEAKVKKDKELYHFSKILMNSLYGKFVQLVKRGETIEASTCWNPIYGAIITANVRVRLARIQMEHPEVVAVHTDSVLSRRKLPLYCTDRLGDWQETVSGIGVILGCGFYQVGDKVRVRGFPFQGCLFELLNKSPPEITIPDTRAITWRLVAANHWDTNMVNRFVERDKVLNINFDNKRVWLDDWKSGTEAITSNMASMPFIVF